MIRIAVVEDEELYAEQLQNYISKYAEERNLEFIDYNTTEFDWEKYGRDGGYHLNIYGADVITQKIENVLKQYELPNHREESDYQDWNENYKLYEELKNKK